MHDVGWVGGKEREFECLAEVLQIFRLKKKGKEGDIFHLPARQITRNDFLHPHAGSLGKKICFLV